MKRLRQNSDKKREMIKLPLTGVLNNLGTAYFLQGDRKTSLAYYREALKESRMYGASKNEETNALHNIGRLYALQKDWDAAVSTLKESLRMEKELYGSSSMPVVDTLNLMGFVHFSTKSYDAAMVIFAEALSIVHGICGLVHEKVATSLLNVGMVMEMQGRLDEALNTFTTARDVLERIGAQNSRGARVATNSIDNIRSLLKVKQLSRRQQQLLQQHGEQRNDTTSQRRYPPRETWKDNNIDRQDDSGSIDSDCEYMENREDSNWEATFSGVVDSRDDGSMES